MFVVWDWRQASQMYDDVRHILIVKANPNLEVLPLTHGALELHITWANYQAK